MEYNANHIIKLSEIEHIRTNPGMYIGSTETPISLLFELFDNALDEALTGHANKIGVFIDNKKGIIQIIDDGRGYPFDESLPLEQDPPVFTCTKLFTSGKFYKEGEESAYKIATGLHGVGNVAVYALSEEMKIEIYRDGKYAKYMFNSEGVTRHVEDWKKPRVFSTKITAKIDSKYFSTIEIDSKKVEERIRLALTSHPNLKVLFSVDGKNILIKGSEDDLILDYLSKTVKDWKVVNDKDSITQENYHLRFGWEPENYASHKILSSVNLVRTEHGVHINKLYNCMRNVFQALAKKHGFSFNPDDCFQGFRAYMSLEIIKTSFDAQVKTVLEKNSNIDIMNSLEKKIKDELESDKEYLNVLLKRMQMYRDSLRSKKVMKGRANKGRANTKYTKLRDCSLPGGELIIGEGDSAIGGVAEHRDTEKHAVLPLRGVIPNALTMDSQRLMKNVEVSDIIQAIGCGIGRECDISKLRYEKIIIATDSDPAGHWIAALLIILFAKLAPDVIKFGHLYLCKTPLFATTRKKKFIPIWSRDELEKCRKAGEKIMRFKGLGEFEPEDIKVFTLDEATRILIPIKWPEKKEEVDKLFELLVLSSEKRKLVTGTWSIN